MIHGAGGGGKGGGGAARAPVEAPNTLRSRAYARVIDVISEGEIEGLVDGLKSIYLDGTPIQAADGALNFQGVSAAWRNGTPTQTHIPGFPAVETEQPVAIEVTAAAPVVRTISNTNVNAVRVTISVPQLSYQNPTNGDLTGTSVELAIDVNNAGGGWQTVKTDTISGKTMSRYQRSYRIDLPAPGPWQVRVRRITPDSTQANLQNKTYWDSLTEIIDAKLRYPNSALVALQIDAAQFNHIPTRGYDIRGLRVRVPSNYNPVTRQYSGNWNGTFQIAWTDNPAWCFYDLLTHERYGLGAYIDAAQVDKWALYEIGKYCDQLVPNGFGGTEPRFTCNLYLQTRQEAYTVIQQMAAIFRGMAWWSQGAITAVADMPSDPVSLFTAANVIDGVFTYSGSSVKSRHTVALVTWNDPADLYRQKIEYVEDAEGIARFGVRETEIVAVGCTSRGQAHRVGRWLLYSERMETETVTFRAGLDGAYVYPGAVIRVQDAARAGRRHGGRVMSASHTVIQLDAAVEIEAGKSYSLSVVLPDGSVQTRNVSNAPGNHAALTLAAPLPAAPLTGAVWVLSASDLAPTAWRVVSVRELEGAQVEITALAHRPEKYAAVEQGITLEPTPVSLIKPDTQPPPAPTELTLRAVPARDASGQVTLSIEASWRGKTPRYRFAWREGDGNITTTEVHAPSARIPEAQVGRAYGVQVYAIDSAGRQSAQALTGTITVTAADIGQPGEVTGLTATGGLFAVRLGVAAPQVWHSDRIEIWEAQTNNRAAAQLVATLTGEQRSILRDGLLPGLQYYYWARIVSAANQPGPWFPASATAGVVGTPSADPAALLTQLQGAIGLPQLAAELAAPIISIDTGMVVNTSGGLTGAVQRQDELLRRLDRRLDDASASVLRAIEEADSLRQDMRDAGIEIDPATGKARLYALERTADRLAQAELALNGAQAQIALKANQTEMDAANSRLATAEGQISVLQGQVAQKAESATVAGIDARLNSAEATLASIDGASIVQQASSLRRAAREDDAANAALLQGLLAADAETAARRTALADVRAEMQAKADSIHAASVYATQTLQARLDTGDFAAVKVSAQASAARLDGVEAKWSVQTQAVQDGNLAVAGIMLNSGGQAQSAFAVLADRFLVYRPDGAGQPRQVMALGQVNGQTALGLDGNLIIDGSIVARHLAANSITVSNRAVIGEAVIDTLRLANQAVTIPVTASRYDPIWGGGGAEIIGLDVALDQPGTILAIATIAQGFPYGDKSWQLRLYIDGVEVYAAGGMKTADSVALSGAYHINTARTVRVAVHRWGDGAAYAAGRTLTVFGVKR